MESQINQAAFSRSRKRLAVWSLLDLLLLIALVGTSGCKKEAAPVAGPPAPKVEGDSISFANGAPQLSSIAVETTVPRTLAITHVTGRLYWNDDTTVRIFTPVAGRVTKVLSHLGDVIAAGSPLAEIDSPDYAQALANARAAVGNLMAADRALTRTKELLAHGAYAQKDVETSEAAYISALAERDRAAAVIRNYGGGDKIYGELERAEAEHRAEASASNYAGGTDATNSAYILRSSLAGELMDKAVNPGQEVRADAQLANVQQIYTPLFVVGDPTKLWLQLDVSEAGLSAMKTGLGLHIISPSFPGKVFDGVIENIGQTMDPNSRMVKVRGVVDNPDKLLKAEMYVLVDVVQDVAKVADSGVEVPAKAIYMKGNDSYLFIEQSPGQYRRQKVKTGVEMDNKVPVFEGLTAGQKVVTDGAVLLRAVVESSD